MGSAISLDGPAFFAGLDPGREGAMVVLHANGDMLDFTRMPLRELRAGNGDRRPAKQRRVSDVPDIRSLGLLVPPIDEGFIVFCVEEVWANSRQGSASSFSFGCNAGCLIAFSEMAGCGTPPRMVQSEEWQPEMLPLPIFIGETTKQRANRKAIETWPVLEKTLEVKANQGIADAALIAEYSRRTYQ